MFCATKIMICKTIQLTGLPRGSLLSLLKNGVFGKWNTCDVSAESGTNIVQCNLLQQDHMLHPLHLLL